MQDLNSPHDDPWFVYGTAWKTDRTRPRVLEALDVGFRIFDTAAQAKHYREWEVGEAIREVLASGKLKRSDLTVRSTCTPFFKLRL